MKALYKKIAEAIWYVIGGLDVIAEEYDPELWDNPRKKERIRRRERMRKEKENERDCV